MCSNNKASCPSIAEKMNKKYSNLTLLTNIHVLRSLFCFKFDPVRNNSSKNCIVIQIHQSTELRECGRNLITDIYIC